MKMLILLNGMTYNVSGGDLHIFKVAEEWRKKHDVTYAMPSSGHSSALQYIRKPPVLPEAALETRTTNIAATVALLLVRLTKGTCLRPRDRFDVIVAASHFVYDVLPSLSMHRRYPTAKLIVYYHGLAVPRPKHLWGLMRRVNDLVSIAAIRKWFDLAFTVSPSTTKFLETNGVSPAFIQETTNGVDKIDEPALASLKSYQACYVGRLTRSKGVYDLIEIWKEVVRRRPEAKLAIVGAGEEKARLEYLVGGQGLNANIQFLGFLKDRRFDVIRASELLLLPSQAESWPIVIAEATSCGVAVVAYYLTEIERIWGAGVTYVESGQKDAFAETVLALLQDPERRMRIVSIAQEICRNFLWDQVADRELRAIERHGR